MRGLLMIAAALVAVPSVAAAQYYVPQVPAAPAAPSYGYTAPVYQAPAYQAPRTTYDYNSGNMYTTTPNYNGGANVQGYNTQNGAMWNTNIQPNGSMTGTSANGNYWTYDARTGTYMNVTTGKICTGTGYARVCN